MFEDEIMEEAVRRLIFWLPDHGKSLPWRGSTDPYRIWVSEIMLQQTRTAAVIPYYERFFSVLPDVRSLAAAPDDVLMKLWEGLGYYSRARNLKKAAVKIVTEYGGELPETYEELRALPGIGDYTAGAVSSLAFGLPEPAVDGNVLRVVMRLLASDEDVLKDTTKQRVIALLRSKYPKGGHSAALTEAFMQLGENVCIPGAGARCDSCPLSDICGAKRGGIVSLLPVRTPKKPRRVEYRTVFILRFEGKIAVCRRPDKGLLAGLYELPNYAGDESLADAFLQKHGMTAVKKTPLGPARHVFTHIEWLMTGIDVKTDTPSEDFRWVTPEELRAECALPTAFKAYADKI